jgi:nitroreductase
MKSIFSSRRSIFPIQFSDKEITDTQLNELLGVANWAPTHRRTEPWRFKVFRGDKKTELSHFLVDAYTKTTPKFSKRKSKSIFEKINLSSAVVLICMKRDEKESVPEWEEIAATAMAVQNLWLQTTELGLGGYWSTPAYINQIHQFIPFEENEKCLGLFYLGRFEGSMPIREPGDWRKKVQWFS